MENYEIPPHQKWFERKFEFPTNPNDFPYLREKLEGFVNRLKAKIHFVSEPVLNLKPGGLWSIKENIGHLYLLESIWLKRLKEIQYGESEMSPADLNNTATNQGNFNAQNEMEIIQNFQNKREETLQFLDEICGNLSTRWLLHPRLKQPMGILELLYFISEHDQHHLESINRILALQKQETFDEKRK